MTADDPVPGDGDAEGTAEALAAAPEDVLALEPDDLDGHSVEELSDYLDAGREPRDPAIEGSPACRHALAALEHLRRISAEFFDDEAAAEPAVDDDWVATVLAAIRLDSSAGRDFTIARDEAVTVLMTEGALRALIRAVGDEVPGFLIGRVRVAGDLDTAGPVVVAIDVNVVHGYAIPEAVEALRAAVVVEVARHTGFGAPTVDVAVRDLHVRRGPSGRSGA